MKPRNSSILAHIVFLILTLIPAWNAVISQEISREDSLNNISLNQDLFLSEDLLRLTIKMDIRKVLKDIGDKRDQHQAEISYLSPEGTPVVAPLKIKTRGHFRRDPMNCDFPPLRLNFSDTLSENSIFAGQDKLKLVTHCRSRGTQYEQNVLKEYLAYKLYNLFTDESYRVRLVELTYVDSKARRDTIFKMGFLLEPAQQMARRNNKQLVEIKNVQQGQCDIQKMTRLSVFQYMVGNTDWSVPVPHNIDLMQESPGIPPVAVPYDFDWCGLVNAPYAVPAENLGISDVTERIYRGLCREESIFELTFQEFREKEQDIYFAIESVPLKVDERENAFRYIRQFYSILNNPNMVRNEFYNACRTP